MGEQGRKQTQQGSNGKVPAADERQAIAHLKRGDIDGLEPLVRQYQVHAVRVAYQIILDRRVAEEIVQEAFLKFHQRIRRFDPARSFWPYFRQIVTNDALKAVDGRKREIPLANIDQGGESGLVALAVARGDRLEAADTRQDIKEALKQLSPRQRTIIVLYYFEDLSEQEIAAELGIALGTVKRNKHDGRNRLVTLLNSHSPAA